MKKQVLVFLLLGVALGFNPLGSVRFTDVVFPGEDVEIHLNTRNFGHRDLEDISASAYFYDLPGYTSTGRFDLDYKDKRSFWLLLPTPRDTPRGYYPVNVVLENEDFHSNRHFWVWIG